MGSNFKFKYLENKASYWHETKKKKGFSIFFENFQNHDQMYEKGVWNYKNAMGITFKISLQNEKKIIVNLFTGPSFSLPYTFISA